MAGNDRRHLGDGVSIQRRGKVWWIDLYHSKKRFRQSLETYDVGEALIMAAKFHLELRAQEILMELSRCPVRITNVKNRKRVLSFLFYNLYGKGGKWMKKDREGVRDDRQ